MSDCEETEQFDNTQPIVHIGDLQLLILTLKPILLRFDDDLGSGAAESSITYETARDGNLWNSA